MDPTAFAPAGDLLQGAYAFVERVGAWFTARNIEPGLVVTGLMGASLTARGIGAPARVVPDAATAALGLLGHGSTLPASFWSSGAAGSLCLPLSMPEEGPGAVPEGVLSAHGLLCAALATPKAPDRHAIEAMEAVQSGRMPDRAFRDHAARRVERLSGSLAIEHAWWETLLLELAVRCREAGSWLAPVHLDPLLVDRPDLRTALRAGRNGAVAREGEAIVAHWQAEKVAGHGLRLPRIAGADAAFARDAGLKEQGEP